MVRFVLRYVLRTGLRGLLARFWLLYVQFYVRRGSTRGTQMRQSLGQSPDGSPLNGVLKSHEVIYTSTQFLKRLGALRHFDRSKNWDLARALSVIICIGNKNAPVLDVGCGWWGGMLLPTLSRYGYRNVHGCDALFPSNARIAGITYHKKDFFETNLSADSIQVITSLSVIEHGVAVEDFLEEAHRLLVPGGVLIISTDYWHEGVASTVQRPFGMAWSVFDEPGITKLLKMAAETGFLIPENLDLDGDERVVTWLGLSYTFIFLVLRKREGVLRCF